MDGGECFPFAFCDSFEGKSKLAEAIRYGLSRKAEFRFLEEGRVELDNNSVERAIRPKTITRKNAQFAGSEAGGQTWATIASLLATARLTDVDIVHTSSGWHSIETISDDGDTDLRPIKALSVENLMHFKDQLVR